MIIWQKKKAVYETAGEVAQAVKEAMAAPVEIKHMTIAGVKLSYPEPVVTTSPAPAVTPEEAPKAKAKAKAKK